MKCGYDEIGALKSVTTKDGGSWVNEGYNRWDYFDKSGHDTGKHIAGAMVDNDTGSVQLFCNQEAQPGKVTRLSDISFPNGTNVTMDVNPTGTKTENIVFQNGDKQTVHYDTSGHPDQITNGIHNSREAGCSWVKKGDTWTQYDDSGDATGATMPKGAWVDAGTALNSTDVQYVNRPDAAAQSALTLINGDIVHRDDSRLDHTGDRSERQN